MRTPSVLLVSLLLGCTFVLAAPLPGRAIDALRPNYDPYAGAGDPVDRLRGGPTYRGLRGYKAYREGYYQAPDGNWYPRWAFGTGEMLGDATVGPRAPVYGMTPQQWCASRYRSYRLSDNTYRPRSGGPRIPCVPQ